MASSLSCTTPSLIPLSLPFIDRTKTSTSLPPIHPPHRPKPLIPRGSLCVARFGFRPGLFPDPDNAEAVIKNLFGRAESIIYTIADAAVSNPEQVVDSSTKQNSDWLSGITSCLESTLKVLKDGLSALHVPYAYGFAIILLTVLVKAATFPLSKKQVESAMAMRSLQPQIKAVQQLYAGDQERIQLETARLYKLAGINPLAGCLPTLATIPVWIGLYRALSNVANEGLLTEGFFWIPSLAGPTTIAERQNGSGISWLFPFVDGQPPLGWSDTVAYLVLPAMLVVLQYMSVQIMQSSQSDDPNVKNSQAIMKFLPLMIGYFSLSVPSGLSLYWLTNNILSTTQQVWLQKLGGAKNPVTKFSNDIVKEDQLQVQKPISELNSIQTKTRQEEKLTPEGSRPGERFKQLKEQEARRRQQREEEERTAEEAAGRGSQMENNEHDSSSFIRGNGNSPVGAAVIDDASTAAIHDSSALKVVNGDLSGQDQKQDGETNSIVEKSEVSAPTEDYQAKRE
ncbi:hypothetical protein POPTR_008G182000v4 [Populus trichocarpa]|uniref:Membrane insertase YidC/Oxa/ALB C-terminal domain-containing protein n=1 Tax=Populus trichocarpa TaxID=3694 RepID=B9HLC7_POPTR|nr:ALBINO3-like protein 1, chloroplastic [Populus trichocarpa]PNT25369.1 hypothetical protein POPTR_008G182000v4 [Populus trichocarpa]|eukprot:XP_002311746.2 ALBINO3-like protein 1, chloroplastic [Populus trichocarpa]